MSWKLFQLKDGSVPLDSPLSNCEVSVEQELMYQLDSHDIPRSTRVFDPEWEYTDSKGHDHYVDGVEYPTLRAVYETAPSCGCCNDDEPYERLVRYECIGCGEEVKDPGTRKEPYQVPAMTTVTIYKKVPTGGDLCLIGDIEPVEGQRFRDGWDAVYQPTEAEWLRIVAAHNEAVKRCLD